MWTAQVRSRNPDRVILSILLLADISGGAKLSSDGVNTWTMIQCEDALIGEGGVLSHTQRGPLPMVE
jgi:hypothetical protein